MQLARKEVLENLGAPVESTKLDKLGTIFAGMHTIRRNDLVLSGLNADCRVYWSMYLIWVSPTIS